MLLRCQSGYFSCWRIIVFVFGPNDFRALVRPIKEVHEKAFSALIIDSAADTEIYDAFYRDRQHLVGGMDVARPRMFSERRQRHDVGNAYWMSAHQLPAQQLDAAGRGRADPIGRRRPDYHHRRHKRPPCR